MPTITVRLSADRRRELDARAAAEDVSASEWVRRALENYIASLDWGERLEDLERRLSRLEQMAGVQ